MLNSETRSVSQRFRATLVEISRYLQQHGYQIKGQTFWYPTPEVCRVVIVSRSRWNTKEECDFGITLGVFVPLFFTYLTGWADPEYPSAQSCAVLMGINEIPERPSQKRTLSWTLRHGERPDKDVTILTQVLKELEKWVIPFLSRFKTISDLIDYLLWVRREGSKEKHPTRPNDVWLPVYLAILYHLQGDAALAEEELQRSLAGGGKGVHFAQEVSKIRERFSSGEPSETA